MSRHLFVVTLGFAVVVAGGTNACHDLTGNQALPAGTQDPGYYNDAAGALGMRNAAVIAFGEALPNYIIQTGLLTDELTDLSTVTASAGDNVANAGAINDPVDERLLPGATYGSSIGYQSDFVYNELQGARTALLQAIGQLTLSDTSAKDTTVLKPAVNRALRGELYALYGYAEIMLADFFCSGIPLSTLDFHKNFTYRAGSPRDSVYWDAISKFDMAIALSSDSVRIQQLARVGQGRAYLNLGRAAVAADDVATVSSDYQYQIAESWELSGVDLFISKGSIVANDEGTYGLPYVSAGDPRTGSTTYEYRVFPDATVPFILRFPRVYQVGLNGGFAPITVGSGVEARLIQAEAALQARQYGQWLSLLNQLRATAPIPGVGQPQPDSLPPLADPGAGLTGTSADSARIALTFQERAYWLYLTGHRQGDLRRQLRQYGNSWHNDQSKLYPSGVYSGLGAGHYGSDITVPIPAQEYLNPLFHGCLNRGP